MKKVIIFILSCILALVGQSLVVKALKSDEILIEALNNTDINEYETLLKVTGEYKDGYITKEDEEEIIKYISEKTQVPKENINIINNDGEQLIDLQVVCIGCDEYMADYLKQLEEIVKECGFTPQGELTIKGAYPGEITQEKMESIAENVFDGIGAKLVSKGAINNEKNNVFYGYSHGLKRDINVAGEKINVSIAFTFNENTGMTNIYAATPVLNIDF